MFDNIGMKIGDIRYLSPREACSIDELDIVFIDVRADYESIAKRIVAKQIVYLPGTSIYEEFGMLDKNRGFIIFDAVGIHSKEVAKFLIEKGFEHIASLAGGIVDWERDGMPMDIDKGELMTGSCMCTLKPKKRFKNNL